MNKLTLLLFWLMPICLYCQEDYDFDALLDSTSVLSKQGAYEQCFQILGDLRQYLREHPDKEKLFFLNIHEAYDYTRFGYYSKAECLFKESIQLAKELGDKWNEAYAWYGLGYVTQDKVLSNSSLPPSQEGKRALFEAIELLKAEGDSAFLVDAYDAQGYAFFLEGKFSEAIEYGEMALELCLKLNDCESEPNILSNLSEYYLAIDDFSTGKKHLQASLKWIEEHPGEIADEIAYNVYRNQADILIHEGKIAEGEQLAMQVLEYAMDHKDPYLLRETNKMLIDYAAARGDYEKAFQLQQTFMSQLDSLHEMQLVLSHDRNQTLLNIGLRDKEYQLLGAKLYSQRVITWSAVGLIVLLLGLLSTVFFLNRQSKQFNAKLKKEVERQTKELRISNEALERFAYVASHDLRTPLRNVISFIGLIQRRLINHNDADLNSFIQYAKDYANHMNRLLNDILDYSKMGERRLVATPTGIDLNQIMEKVFPMVKDDFREKQGILEVGLLPTVYGDETSLIRLFQNLLENAITYNDKETPLVAVQLHSVADGYAVFCVSDNGIGIDRAYHEKVFEMFTRLHNMEQYPGTGLGLAICKRIVNDMGGEIWMDSSEGAGTSVFFTLPLIEVEHEQQSQEHGSKAAMAVA
ncbi:MAG: hypothetical protein Kow0027_20620 [Saprospiraceae bacterium]